MGEVLEQARSVVTSRVVGADGRHAIAKTVAANELVAAARRWIELQIALLNDLPGGATALPVRMDVTPDTLTLTRPFVDGRTLAENLASDRPAFRLVVDVGIRLLDALELVHSRGIVHGDIKPSNIVLENGAWERPVLVDFALARHMFLREPLTDAAVDLVRYLAPEQSGVLQRGVDARADLYALGLTLHEAISGKPAFAATTVSELLRDQLTQTPPALDSVVPSVPRALARVISLLLRKDPRERYQSAAGVRADLELIAAGLARGDVQPEVVVGARDRRESLTEPAFTGRVEELAVLSAVLDEAGAGEGGLVLVEGESGSGKTWLLEEIARRAAHRGIWVVRGYGLVQVAPRPFQVLSGLARDISSSAAPGSTRAQGLVDRAGMVGGTIAEVLPALGAVFGVGRSDTAVVEPKDEERGIAALSALLDALGSGAEPALVLIDDAQWADSLTLRLLERWQGSAGGDPRHVVVVVAFRSEDVGADHRLRTLPATRHLTLGPLRDDEVREQLASMAGRLPDDAIQLIIDQSGGNPFLASAALHGLVAAGALSRAGDGWQLAAGALAELRDSGRIKHLWAARIARLPAAAGRLLRAGALLGRTFDPTVAGELAGIPPAEVIAQLARVRGSLIWLSSDGAACTFLHDRIREQLLSELPEAEQKRLHLEAANRSGHGADRDFDIAYHYDAAGDPRRALPHALAAAERARSQHDMELAERYYTIARRGVCDDTSRSIRYRIMRGLADVCLVRSGYDDCERTLDEAYELAEDDASRADIEERRAQLELKRGDLPAALRHGEQALRLVGRYVPRSGLVCALIVVWELFVQVLHTAIPRLFVGRRSSDGADAEMFAIRVYNGLNGPYFFGRGAIWVLWAHLRALNLSERYPPGRARGREYAVHGSACAGFPRLFPRAVRYTREGARICAEHGDVWGQARANQFLALNLCATGRYREAVSAAEQGARLFERAGDSWEAQGTLCWAALARYRLGDLAGAAACASALYERARRTDNFQAVAFTIDAWVRAMEGRLPAQLLQDELARAQAHVQTYSLLAQAEAMRLLSEDEPARAEALIESALGRMRKERAFLHEANVSLVVYLVTAQRQAAERVPAIAAAERQRILARTRRSRRKALAVADSFPSCRPHALREAALLAAMEDRPGAAHQLADRSVEAAERLGARFELALSRQVRGELGVALGWPGAAGELEAARTELLVLRRDRVSADQPPRASLSLIERFSALLAAGHRIARSLDADSAREALREEAMALLRAQRAAIVERTRADDANLSVVSGDAGPISATLVAEAARAGHPVVLPRQDRAIDDDDALARSAVRSVLCAPIFVRGRVAALLYVTHADVSSVFGSQETQIAEFLTTLAGAALENAQGFLAVQELSQTLERRVAERTAELAQANTELKQSLHRLELTQQQLLHAGRMAAVGTLVAGLSHELNNPLTVIVGNTEHITRLAPSDERLQRVIAAVDRQAKRAAKLVHALLSFSRAGSGPPQRVAAAEIVRAVMELVGAEAEHRDVEVTVSVPDDLPELNVVAQDIESALVNITLNALQATAAGGEVQISAETQTRASRAGVRFRVRDSGSGISSDVLEQIFDPFFTTKPPGQGTGLGLSLARQAIAANGGEIEIDSRPGAGTTMNVWLPMQA